MATTFTANINLGKPAKGDITWWSEWNTNADKLDALFTNPTRTSGSVLYYDSANKIADDSVNFFWNATAKRLGIGTNAPVQTLDVNGTMGYKGTSGAAQTHYFNFSSVDTLANAQNSTLNFRRNFDNIVLMTLDGTGRLGLGTSTPLTTMQIGTTPTDVGSFVVQGPLFSRSATNNGGSTPAAFEPALILGRSGITAQAYANFVQFNVGRYAAISTNAKTQLDIRLMDVSEATGTAILSLQSGGNVGIGTTTPGAQLDLSTDSARKLTTTTWTTGSDARIKTDIHEIDDALEILRRIRPVGFRYTPQFLHTHPEVKDVIYYNFLSQEYAQVFPHSVTEMENGLLYLNNSHMIPYAVAAIKALDKYVTTLAVRLAQCEKGV